MTRSDFIALKAQIDPRTAAFFLDFDGTLIDLAATPDGIVVPDELIPALNDLHSMLDGRVAIITGRSDSDVARYLVKFRGPVYASHGGCLHWNGMRENIAAVPDNLQDLTDHARQFASQHPPSVLEEKSMGFAIHYRAKPDLETTVREYVDGVAAGNPTLAVQSSKMAFEVKAAEVSKGAALDDAVSRFGWTASTPWMFGDDTTDEVAFQAAQALGGYGVKIGQGESVANYRLRTPADLHDLMTNLRTNI